MTTDLLRLISFIKIYFGEKLYSYIYQQLANISVMTNNCGTLHPIFGILSKYVIDVFVNFLADGKPPIFEKSFMQDIALQNFTKYMVTSLYATPPPVSIFSWLLWLAK